MADDTPEDTSNDTDEDTLARVLLEWHAAVRTFAEGRPDAELTAFIGICEGKSRVDGDEWALLGRRLQSELSFRAMTARALAYFKANPDAPGVFCVVCDGACQGHDD
jgi:hypothetical protein